MGIQNLDRLCAQFGYEISRQVGQQFRTKDGKPDKAKTENLITKSLGILQEDGVYAFFLYQVSRGQSETAGAKKLREQSHALLKEANVGPFGTLDDSLEAVRGSGQTKGVADDLEDLLLAKRLLEHALIYARYHAKALEG